METNNLTVGSRLNHPSFGEGIIIATDEDSYTIYFSVEKSEKTLAKDYQGFELIEGTEAPTMQIDMAPIENAFVKMMMKYMDTPQMVALGNKWKHGKIVIKPGSPDLQEKELPIETLFHKIVIVRDRLRVLEQNINSHKKLDDEDKVHLQQYITRAYGSLTSFNLLFQNKSDHFKGQGKS